MTTPTNGLLLVAVAGILDADATRHVILMADDVITPPPPPLHRLRAANDAIALVTVAADPRAINVPGTTAAPLAAPRLPTPPLHVTAVAHDVDVGISGLSAGDATEVRSPRRV